MHPAIQTIFETGSTNADMLDLARAGTDEGFWLRAERQSAGRGRMGRHWTSLLGNLSASTIIRLRSGDPSAATLGLVAAVAVTEVVRVYAPDAVIQIKWPNDVMAGGAKLSGILLERSGDAVVLGIGVNLASAPEGLERAVTSLVGVTGHTPDPAHFLETLTEAFARWLARWRGEGLGPVLTEWRAHAHPPGTVLTVNLPDGAQLEGLFHSLDADGALKLRLADGAVRVIHAGDVFLI
jgi:BirA family transcriptional regulator, biotin operon repressor / biotin---[acetyl-CoA-carboxylase] ligase